MTSRPPENEPMTVEVLADEVAISGPDGIGVSITADSAAESGKRLSAAAEKIREGKGQLENGTEDEAKIRAPEVSPDMPDSAPT